MILDWEIYNRRTDTGGHQADIQVDAASSEAINNTDRVYFIRANGDRLFFKSPGVIVPMTGATSVVEFEMVKAN